MKVIDKDDEKYKALPDLRMISAPPITHPDFELWQFNATEEARKYLAGHLGYIKYANVNNLINKLFYVE
ncbi:MAG: hypothetical protein J1F01_00825 [Oscillospiraceae bacterium]|nr:hypothetical protein [Oscillospiraceae bacterium]